MSLEHSLARDDATSAGRPKGEGSNQAPPVIDRIVGETECEHITDASRTTRWRMMKRGEFPQKVRISPNRTGWLLSEVMAWLAQRKAA
jgi:predicted DNA-binding transcriptional regulator AlpA